MHSLDEWGLGGRSFGPVLTWFLLSGTLYTAYTFVALPAVLYGAGAVGFFAVSFAAVTPPLVFVALTRMWSVAHVHGLVTPADFVRARFGSPTLELLVAVSGVVATMPYVALQLVGMEAVLKVLGLDSPWPLWTAFGLLAVFTYNAGLRAPALFSVVKDILVLWVVLAVLVFVASTGGWRPVFDAAEERFAATPQPTDGLLLTATAHLNFATLVLGSALALFLYPHAVTATVAARNRNAVRWTLVALPVYTLALAVIALLGYVAIAREVLPVGADPDAGILGDSNTIMPKLFADRFPDWVAGTAYAAVVIGAFVPAAIMSIGAANLFTRNVYKVLFRPSASPAEETKVSRTVSLAVKLGAVAVVVFVEPQFALDLQLVGGVIILQALPSVGLGLFTSWLHRHALVAGLVVGLVAGIAMLYQVPPFGPGGGIVHARLDGSAWWLSRIGMDFGASVYVGLVAVALNLAVAVVATLVLRLLHIPDGHDITWRRDYLADEGDAALRRLDEILDGRPVQSAPIDVPAKHTVLARMRRVGRARARPPRR